jgi:hypothetical protein
MKRMIGMIVTMAVMMWCNSAMAIDAGKCSQFPHNWGYNVECLGMLEASDMINEAGEWKQSFLDIYYSADPHLIWSPVPALEELAPVIQGSSVFGAHVDNRRFGDGRAPDSRFKFKGIKNSMLLPQIWAMEVKEPGDPCELDSDWHGFQECGQPDPDITYPLTIYHIDWNTSQECSEICEDSGWDFSPGSACETCNADGDNDGLPDSWAGVTMRSVGEQLTVDDIAGITWVEGGETATVKDIEFETYYILTYDTGSNNYTMPDWTGGAPVVEEFASVYCTPFNKQAPMGDHTYIVTLADGSQYTFILNIASDTVMPTVAKLTQGLTYLQVKHHGKKHGKKHDKKHTEIKEKTKKGTYINLQASEIENDNGETRLLVQWAAPDRAMELTQTTRLRIYIGNGWFATPADGKVFFVWMDVPLHTGSVVVPATAYTWIQDTLGARGETELAIGGMYREQFPGYHNRGYIEGIRFDIR